MPIHSAYVDRSESRSILCLTASSGILFFIETPLIHYIISSSFINYGVSPCIIPSAHLLLFAGYACGELILVYWDELQPSTGSKRVLCKEQGRIRLDCGVIKYLYCTSSFEVILSDDRHTTMKLSLLK